MVIATDTSFLFSLYGNDSHSLAAIEWIIDSTEPIYITNFNDYELRNSLRFSEYCKRTSPGSAEKQLAMFEASLMQGRLVHQILSADSVLAEANRLSRAHTLTGGHRGFDILHVAAAKMIGATHFLSFDSNQKRLAEKEGLNVPL